ncbi:MAG: tetratricopeptide repeat protein [Myxococcales bacterium]|jgi:tetratricopeptide (TPR) repeat protein|nr:tetratricopeptide repeat protein [Myxococcales bacterium]
MKRLALTCAVTLALSACATTSSQPPPTAANTTTTLLPPKGSKQTNALPAEQRRAEERQVAATLRTIEARVRKGESAQMRQEFTERLNRHPNDLIARLFLAWIDAPSESAGTQLNALAKMNPEQPWLRTALARVYMTWKGFAAQAGIELDGVLAQHPDFVPALVARAELERVQGRRAEALTAFRALVLRDPLCFEAHFGLSVVLEEMGDLPGARAALEAALDLDPSHPEQLLRRLANLLSRQGDTSALLPLYEKLLALDPQDRVTRRQLGDLRKSLGDLEGAVQDLERLQEDEPTVELTRELLDLYVRLDRSEDEQRALEILVQFDEGVSVDVYRRLFALREREGDLDGAETALRQAIARAPQDLDLRESLAQNLRARDLLIPAILAYREGVALGVTSLRSGLKTLEARVGLSPEPLRGNVGRIYNLVHLRLRRALNERHKAQPWLGGTLGVRATIGPQGKITAVEITNNTLQDPELTALVYFDILDAELPGERPRSVSFEFIVSPIEGEARTN